MISSLPDSTECTLTSTSTSFSPAEHPLQPNALNTEVTLAPLPHLTRFGLRAGPALKDISPPLWWEP